jgi:hypothetical protein
MVARATGAAALAGTAIALFSCSQASARSVQCSARNAPDLYAIHLKSISGARACAIWHALPLQPFSLYRCIEKTTPAGSHLVAVLTIHTFEGWKLAVLDGYTLKLSRGNSSFELTGQGLSTADDRYHAGQLPSATDRVASASASTQRPSPAALYGLVDFCRLCLRRDATSIRRSKGPDC